MVDDAGAEPWLVTLTITNRGSENLYFANEWIPVESKVGDHWIETENRFGLTWLAPGWHRDVLLLMPVGTESCRLSLKWAPPSWPYRMWGLGKKFGVRVPAKFYRWALEAKHHWIKTRIEIPFPGGSARLVRDSSGLHNERRPFKPQGI
jgi:hypothetical protein